MNLLLRRLEARADRGASAVEYGLIIAAIAAVIVAIVFALGTVVKDKYSSTSSCISAQENATC